MEAIGTLTPVEGTQEGRTLLAGELIVTVTSKASGRHVTLRLRPSLHGDDAVPFEQATHVVVEDYDGERLATYFPLGGIAWKLHADEAQRWSIKAVLRWCAGDMRPSKYAFFDAETFAAAA